MAAKINLFTYDINKRTLSLREIECIDQIGYVQVYDKSFYMPDIVAGRIIGFDNRFGVKSDNSIYFYTFISDPNEALKVIEKWIEDEYVSARDNYERLSEIHNNFDKTKVTVENDLAFGYNG